MKHAAYTYNSYVVNVYIIPCFRDIVLTAPSLLFFYLIIRVVVAAVDATAVAAAAAAAIAVDGSIVTALRKAEFVLVETGCNRQLWCLENSLAKLNQTSHSGR